MGSHTSHIVPHLLEYRGTSGTSGISGIYSSPRTVTRGCTSISLNENSLLSHPFVPILSRLDTREHSVIFPVNPFQTVSTAPDLFIYPLGSFNSF